MAAYIDSQNPMPNQEGVNSLERLPDELLLHIIKILLMGYDHNGNLRLKTKGFKILVETIRKISQR